MKFNFFDRQPEIGNNIERTKKEERDGLSRFYNEIVPPEILRQNFENWQKHLLDRLALKYSRVEDRENALKKAQEYARTIPVRHGTLYKNIRSSSLPYFSSDFVTRQSGKHKFPQGGTLSFDRKYELDHFVYCRIGVFDSSLEGYKEAWDTQCYLESNILNNDDVLVSLEDYASTMGRLIPQTWKGNKSGDDDEEAFDVHKHQIWRGPDFKILFPMMLAYAYSDPNNFDKQVPFPLDAVPDNLPRLIREDYTNGYREIKQEFPHFEVRIPRSINPKEIMAFFCEESAVRLERSLGSTVVVIPETLSPPERVLFVKEKLKTLHGGAVPSIEL